MSVSVILAALLCLLGLTAASAPTESDLLTLDFEPLLMAASSRSGDSSDVDSKFLSDLAVTGNVTILSDWQTALTGIYDYIVKDYMSGIYTDVIEGYLIATVKLVGWATFGSFLILKGALLNALFAEPAGYGYARGWGEGGSLTEELGLGAGGGEYTVPYLEEWTNLKLSFPVDDSLQGCYRERDSCMARDLGGEVSHLAKSVLGVWHFLGRWWQLPDQLEQMAMDGQI